ncbi:MULTISPECIES: RNA pyrophosphohydrolase [Bartonella]|uniref:RNA pyrophosphohydrolase n=1 Tax=Bartonella choladocola TaxID=2750995 RepID=A0A1U9MGC6_9HYPH|nr:RNA pyrophosphohydrolase [Bartonella choladocola]AQT46701.1 putative (di)nucleoside polyphosphate hydrolase [Bartonella choladocola]MBI0140061.1 RNA pyrophosphohydrolase [Bartonella choladocola]
MTKSDSEKQKKPMDLPYRKCVGIALFNKNGQVWAGRRITNRLSELKGASKIWQMPQGGIDKGEEPIDAAKRELYEETGVHSIELIEETEGWVTYDLPEELVGIALKGKYRGQTQKWFAFRFLGDDKEIAINPPPENNAAEFDQWKWVDLEALPMMVVPFKQAVYEKVVAQFRHIVC